MSINAYSGWQLLLTASTDVPTYEICTDVCRYPLCVFAVSRLLCDVLKMTLKTLGNSCCSARELVCTSVCSPPLV